MFGVETLSGDVRAVALIAIVLAEAVALHVGYSGLTRLAAPTFRRFVGA